MGDEALIASIREAIGQGRGEAVGGLTVLPLVTLESETRIAIDDAGRWVVLPPDRPPIVCGPDNAHVLTEALEWKRSAFDDALEASARTFGLPPDDVLLSCPVFALVGAALETGTSYLVRLGLSWLVPTELRPMRAAIVRVTAATHLPASVRDLADRLVVPE